jgi:hypothetical protein
MDYSAMKYCVADYAHLFAPENGSVRLQFTPVLVNGRGVDRITGGCCSMPATISKPSALITPELLNLTQTAAMLSVCERTVLNLGDRLPPVKLRRCTRWRRADVLKFIEQLDAK